MKPTSLKYVLVSPARNEEAYIELTIQSVIHQTVRPEKWVIVSDGSTDRTDEIVKKYTAEHDWIELVRRPERKVRHFAGKVDCFNSGYARLAGIQYDVIGNLDADMSFDPEYYAFLLGKLLENPKLGVIGTPFREGDVSYDFRFSSTDHVSGACQLFRRECFEAIGGYTPVKGGGIDVIAVLTARMRGWQTRTFPEKFCHHHRTMGSAKHNTFVNGLKLGEKDYTLGRHPLWEIFRSFYQMSRRPFVIGGATLLMGYLWAMIRRVERPVSKELIAFQRREQMMRLRKFITNKMPLASQSAGER
jgi:glycosyltransferase involved in cell wall biosynthesis